MLTSLSISGNRSERKVTLTKLLIYEKVKGWVRSTRETTNPGRIVLVEKFYLLTGYLEIVNGRLLSHCYNLLVKMDPDRLHFAEVVFEFCEILCYLVEKRPSALD